MRLVIAITVVITGLAACASSPSTGPSTHPAPIRPLPAATVEPTNGAIFRAAAPKSLFDDRRARTVGDTLVINIVEKTRGKKTSSSSADRSHSNTLGIPAVSGLPLKSLQGMELESKSENKFAGSGNSSAENDLSGVIACTVVEVLPNGYLVVTGEKRVAINQAIDFVKFSGVVNPMYISGSNSVDSTYVADARIEYKGAGYLNDAQTMGWLGRFFLSVLPF